MESTEPQQLHAAVSTQGDAAATSPSTNMTPYSYTGSTTPPHYTPQQAELTQASSTPQYMSQIQQAPSQYAMPQPALPLQTAPPHVDNPGYASTGMKYGVNREFAINCTMNKHRAVSLAKLICWLAMLIPAAIAMALANREHRRSTNVEVNEYLLTISTLLFVADLVLVILFATGILAQISKTQIGMLMGYNSLSIFLCFLAFILTRWLTPPSAYISARPAYRIARLSDVGVGVNTLIVYQIFSGLGIAMCGVELSFYSKWLKEL